MNTPSGGFGVTNGEYLMHPERKAKQRRLIFLGRGFGHRQIRDTRLGMRRRHADAKTDTNGRLIDASENAPLSLQHRRHERFIPRGKFAPHPPHLSRVDRALGFELEIDRHRGAQDIEHRTMRIDDFFQFGEFGLWSAAF
jgi:hypothetical protein